MQHLDLQVVSQARAWLSEGEALWFCTVLSTFGSSPREPGSLFVARADGAHAGSLSGGCVEEDFLARIGAGEFQAPATVVRYGGDSVDAPGVTLPCGGSLDVLVEHWAPEPARRAHLAALHEVMAGRTPRRRRVSLRDGAASLEDAPPQGAAVERGDEEALIRVGPTRRLIIAGISPVSRFCAEFATAMGFEVIVCDPDPDACADFAVAGVTVREVLPSLFIEAEGCHAATAVVALTHDPRIDDLAMMEAVRTPAFYIGVMGSRATSAKRAERLRRSGHLSAAQIERLHMPIGLALGSKTPAEIALAVMADILRVYRGKERSSL
ncbi:XdhC family protein [Alcanivorax sp. ZXX171]|nr:XdhC family protein [Alcanivorax sp. ZXX171]